MSILLRTIFALVVLTMLFTLASTSRSQPRSIATLELLQTALERRLTVWRTADGTPVYVRHCRAARPGCEARIAALSRWLVTVGVRYDLDPFLLAAMAVKESGLSPFAEGSVGERGIVQLHPRGVGRQSRFVGSEEYRRLCRNHADACQGEVLDLGAQHLRRWVDRCGTLEDALGGYNTGRCGGSPAYTRRVLRERERLRRGLVEDQPSAS